MLYVYVRSVHVSEKYSEKLISHPLKSLWSKLFETISICRSKTIKSLFFNSQKRMLVHSCTFIFSSILLLFSVFCLLHFLPHLFVFLRFLLLFMPLFIFSASSSFFLAFLYFSFISSPPLPLFRSLCFFVCLLTDFVVGSVSYEKLSILFQKIFAFGAFLYSFVHMTWCTKFFHVLLNSAPLTLYIFYAFNNCQKGLALTSISRPWEELQDTWIGAFW